MKISKTLIRKSHFLGTKIRNLRKRNHLTMDDLSSRCIKIDPESAPSVSYLSMIERGKRVPSEGMLKVIATVFQKDLEWFLDGADGDAGISDSITPHKGTKGGIHGMPLEPSFLFSKEILQIAIPEMLSQTGTTGRQFAHLLIRAHQEHNQNHFPDLERAAEEVGHKRMPISVAELTEILQSFGVIIKFFRKLPQSIKGEINVTDDALVTSFFAPPHTLYLNESLKKMPTRLKYDMAVHIGHCVLHNRDGLKSVMVAGSGSAGLNSGTPEDMSEVDAQDILYAWRDFECSFFAGALLCPKVPFRQLLDRQGYSVTSGNMADVSVSVAMRRMTAVSPYPHWHFFDAYPPGRLKAVYRGNGIPLPWGNMRMVEDPCQHWAVFRNINALTNESSAQISILNVQGKPRIYCCESINLSDLSSTNHVLCAGIDLNPAIEAQGKDALAIAEELKEVCNEKGGSAEIPASIKSDLTSVAKILNIGWVERGLETEARLICSRGGVCPRKPACPNACQS
ncbi:MAG: DUF3612 domain-containing protein [Gammaproteobacteria bacterium]|nr:DUF3612 domain-containing protein [Gammaproteobacteria bacterium]NNJ72132.1 DUF3612 domain-containing protein [Enterobacterales bacterium]